MADGLICYTATMASPEPPRHASPLPFVHRLVPQVYYGWFVMAGSFVLSFVSVGIGFYGQTVFLDGLIREHDWTKAEVSGASTFYFIVSGIAGMGVGRWVDRHGARGTLFAGAATMSAALIGLGRVDRPIMLYPVYGLLAASFAMTAAVPLNAILGRWFVRRRALAMSLSQTGVSLGGIALVPLSTTLIEERGMGATTLVLAALALSTILPITAWVIRSDPRDHGLLPDGAGTPPAAAGPAARAYRVRDLIGDDRFSWLAGSFSLILFCQTGLSVHVLHLLRDHLSATTAASGVSILAAGSIAGRLCIGQVADRLDKRRLAALLFALQAIAHFALSAADDPSELFAATLLFGLTIGSVFMLQSLLVMELFGMASFGRVFGVQNFVTSLAGGLGPLAVGAVAQAAGGYPLALRMLGGVALVGALSVCMIRGPDAQVEEG